MRLLNTTHVRFLSYSSQQKIFEILTTMPKEPQHIAEAQKQRRKIKEKLSRYVPGKVTLQVLGTGAKGAPRALYMFSDQSRYLFNCGEGTQRLAHEHKMKLSKIEHIFITQPIWKNIGGLPGIALTIQDVGVPEITLHGPKGLFLLNTYKTHTTGTLRANRKRNPKVVKRDVLMITTKYHPQMIQIINRHGQDEIFAATKRFVVIRDLKIHMAECNETNIFSDNVMSVRYVPIYEKNVENNKTESEDESDQTKRNCEVEALVDQTDASTSTRSNKRRSRKHSITREFLDVEDNIDYYAHERKRKHRIRSRSRSKSSSTDSELKMAPKTTSENSREVLKEIKDKNLSMVYVCNLHPRPGALNLNKCVEMGVPPGPLLGKLKSGEDITLPNGNTVRSKDVCEPEDPGPIFIVVDCVNSDYIESLIISSELKKHQKFALSDEDVACLVVHFTPKEVVNDPRYKKWMNDFPASTQHLMLNEMNTCMGSESVHRVQHKLNLLSECIFPLLGDKGTEVINEASDLHMNKKQKCEEILNENESTNGSIPNIEALSMHTSSESSSPWYLLSNTFCSYHLRPKRHLDRTSELKLNVKEYINEAMMIENFPNVLKQINGEISEKMKQLIVKEYPKILFLGTGSCIPNKTRNTSGILVKLSDSQSILLDCGEGTYGQLVRFFGNTVDQEIAKINAIYVSHLHADHHIGFIGLLQGRRRAINTLNLNFEPVYLFAPKQILAWLNFYDKFFENISQEYQLIPNSDFLQNDPSRRKLDNELSHHLGVIDVVTCFVRHCPNAFGVCLTDKNGIRMTYSGDTMPCDNLIEIGKDSDILIHEATMEDELAHEAVLKMHSTTTQAIEIGKKMNAKNIMLTHFSQRYAKLPRFNDNFTSNIGIAFDNMQVRLDELPLVPTLYPAFKLIFAEHNEELEHKAVKRKQKIERDRGLSLNKEKQNSS